MRYTLPLAFAALTSALPSLLQPRQVGSVPPHHHDDPHKPAKLAEYDPETWTLGTKEFTPNRYQTQPYVANGYHGSRLTAEGHGYWKIYNETGATQPINGWPLDNARQTVATITGFWDSQRNTTRTNFPELLEKGGESVISGIPTWSTFVIATANGDAYAPGIPRNEILGYKQTSGIKDGVVTTWVKWRPGKEGVVYELKFTVIAHRARINLGMMRIEVTPSKDAKLILTDILDGAGAQRTTLDSRAVMYGDDAIFTAVHPTGVPNVTAHEFSTLDLSQIRKLGLLEEGSRCSAEDRPWVTKNESTISQEYTVHAKKGQKLVIDKYVGIASSDAFQLPCATASKAALEAKKVGWEKLVKEHHAAWVELWDDADIVIPEAETHDLQELQISIRASIFHLLSNVRSAEEGPGIADNSISVGGLTSDSYAGLVFWDADLWMMPGLLALHPEHAAAITKYRQNLFGQAQENAKEYDLPGVLYPWTSGRYGNCTGTGPCVDYQYHLNTDIALVHWHQFLTTGNETWLEKNAWPVIKAVADMWTAKVVKAPTSGEDGLLKGMYTVNNMTDPDEYANHIDNGAFTNAGVKVILGIAQQAASVLGLDAPSSWSSIESNMFIPYNTHAHIIPEYAEMNGSVQIKQADVVLINYPLEFRLNETQARNDLDFYARAQSPDGPAMTWAMFAINALDLSPHGCASWSYTLYASQPYLREPYYQFSEQIIDDIYVNGNTNPAFPFLTGHGWFLQISTHGFTGYRPRLDALYLDPSIPPQLTSGIEVKGLKHRGASFNILITPTDTTITRRVTNGENEDPITVRIAERNESAGDHPLAPGESLVIPTRRPDLNGTDIPNNLAECKRTTSSFSYVPGQFPLSATDGSNHTNWRPATDKPAAILVDLEEQKTFSKLSLNWARWPPLKAEVLVSTDKKNWERVWRDEKVGVSDPWKEEDSLEVRRTEGNQTNVELEREWTGRWVRLVVEGDREGRGVGGTVAQFAVL